jgi:dinuclear metal center YbgI/SA1388 family protein
MADLLRATDAVSPFSLAAEWDNVGLLAGRTDWPASVVLLAIDLTDAVAREAMTKGAEALVVYHPPIFKGIRTVTPAAGGPTSLLPDLLAARISVVAVHTALDAAAGGTNDILLDFFETLSRRPLEPAVVSDASYKLVVFVPPDQADQLRTALCEAGAGVIGNYHECSFAMPGRGSFRGDESSNPTIGERGKLEFVEEQRLEMVVPRARLGEVVRALYASHSYEEPAFDLYPVHALPHRAQAGMGRVGTLPAATRGTSLLERLRPHLDLSSAVYVGDLERSFTSVTTAAGSFGVRSFRDPDSLVLTGELKHHDALDLLRRGITAVCLGHDASERPLLPVLRERLRSTLVGASIEIAETDGPVFRRVGTS